MALTYLSLIKVSPAHTRDVEKALRELITNPPAGVKVEGAWSTFGAIDFAIAFSAENPESAMTFVVDKIRFLPGVTSTETLQGQSLAPART
jgi:DNA-binding Lrp family transcriptional regulator